MNPLSLLALGLAIVLGGILWLRLHPFLALILGAFAVGGLTSADHLHQSMASKYRGELVRTAIKDGVANRIRELKGKDEPFDAQVIRQEVKGAIDERANEFDAAAEGKAREFVKSNSTLTRITAALGTTCEKLDC